MASFATHFYFSPRGRTGRRLYWMFGVVPFFLLGLAIGIAAAMVGVSRDGLLLFVGLTLPVALWAWIAIGARRLHDIGVSGWWMILVLLAPAAVSFALPERLEQLPSLLAMIALGMVPGATGVNRFGSDPNARDVGELK